MRSLMTLLLFLALPSLALAEKPAPLKLLFLGDNAGHQPKTRFEMLEPVLAATGIQMTYTDTLNDITLDNLNNYDGLVIYANQATGKPEHVKAILDYVASGKGFIPLHCASFCFINNDDYVKLVGAQFRSHTTGVFRVENTQPDHPIMKGFTSFEGWDETYVHTKHNEKDRIVLEVRAEADFKEPWTWIRTHGKGRVFYTAWGHDQRTWCHDGFQNLVERGIRWACGQEPTLAGDYIDAPAMKTITGKKSDFEYVPAKVPFYPPSKQWGTIADPLTTMQKPLSPEKSVTHYTMPDGFEMKLFASDDQFGGKPINMTWDEQGRLWVAVTVDYPNDMQRSGQGNDKILICEDVDGDGAADKFTTFAEKLSIPTSLLCVHGGVLVHQAPHTLFLKDTDGDGKADLRQEIISGWGTNDTHAGPSSLRYGFDGWVYGIVGYSAFNGTVAGERLNFRQGLYRFQLTKDGDHKLNVTKMEFLRSVSNNCWGVAFNQDGELFGSTANGCVLVHMPIANRYYEKVRGVNPKVLAPIALDNRYHPVTDKVRQVDWHGGFTSAAGCAIYTAATYPSYFQNTAFVSDPTGHLTATFKLMPSNSTYYARYGWNLVASQDEWAAPIDAQVGPDGHMWVLDWYNYIVQHNPTPKGFENGKGNAYETPLRDKSRGRIYRVVYKQAKAEPRLNLKVAKPEQLIETLKHHNMTWRLHAQRLLVERGSNDIVPSLLNLVQATGNNDYTSVHALQTIAQLPPVEDAKAEARWKEILEKGHPRIILAAIDAMPVSVSTQASALINLMYHPDPAYQLAATLKFADLPVIEQTGAYLLRRILDNGLPTDDNLNDAMLIAAGSHSHSLLMALAKNPNALPAKWHSFVGRVAEEYGRSPFAKDVPVLLPALAMMQDAATRDVLLNGIATGWPTSVKPQLDAKASQALASLLTKSGANSRAKLLRLASTWGVEGLDAQLAEIAKDYLEQVSNSQASEAARLKAAAQVIEFLPSSEDVATKFVEALQKDASATFVNGLLENLSQSRAKNYGQALLAKIPQLPVTSRPAALRLILSRPEPTKAFLDAVEKGQLRFDLLALEQKTALSLHPDRTIAERAKKLLAMGGGLPNPDRQKVIEQFAEVVHKTGDVGLGKKVFIEHCAKCHKHGSEGMQIGPDLTGFAVHPKEEILIHVLDPSRSVEGNYKSYTASLLDGRVIQGLLTAESRTSIEILDAENKRIPLNRDDIDELAESKKSLMPEGFEKSIDAEGLTNLLEFLTQKGKYIPIPLDKVATVVSTKGMFFADDGETERMIFRDWKPKEFEGVPFALVDPNGDKIKNAILLYGPNGTKAPKMPKSVVLPCNTATKAIHFLSGVGGWSFPASEKGSVSMIVRFKYADGKTEDHELKNGVHFADYIRRVDVPESQFAFRLRNQQLRYLKVTPKRPEVVIQQVELVKGPDGSAPIVMAVTIETK